MSLDDAINLTNAVGAAGFLLSIIGYCIVRRISNGGQTPSRMYCNSRLCWCIGLLKIAIGILEITYFRQNGGTWWGWLLILFAIFWCVRGNKFRKQAQTLSLGYQPFNENNVQPQQQQQQQQDNIEERTSNAPQIIIHNGGTNTAQPSLSSMYPAAACNSLQQPMMSNDPTPLIRNAVPPSPFLSSNSYVTPSIGSIPMATTITPKGSGYITTKGRSTDYYNNDIDHKDDNKDEDDGKNEIEDQTPNGDDDDNDNDNQLQSRKTSTSEGNVTFS